MNILTLVLGALAGWWLVFKKRTADEPAPNTGGSGVHAATTVDPAKTVVAPKVTTSSKVQAVGPTVLTPTGIDPVTAPPVGHTIPQPITPPVQSKPITPPVPIPSPAPLATNAATAIVAAKTPAVATVPTATVPTKSVAELRTMLNTYRSIMRPDPVGTWPFTQELLFGQVGRDTVTAAQLQVAVDAAIRWRTTGTPPSSTLAKVSTSPA